MKLPLLPIIIFPLATTAMVTPKLPAGLEKRQAVSYPPSPFLVHIEYSAPMR